MKKLSWTLVALLASLSLCLTGCPEEEGDDDDSGDMTTDMTTDGDDDTMVDGGDDMTDGGDDTTDGGDDTTDTTDADDTEDMVVRTVCDDYCDTVQANCAGSNQQHASREDCMSFCEGVPEGTDGDTAADSVYCRLYHAGDPSVADPDFHCAHAGVDGGDVCTDGPGPNSCDRFCANVVENCANDFAVYADLAECQSECENFDDTGNFGDDAGDTLQCRDRYAQLAFEDPILCLAAASSGGGVCINPGDNDQQLDRMGRPAINTALIASDHKDLYNFATPADGGFFAGEMAVFLQAIDDLDGDDTNGAGPALFINHATLGAALAADFLVVYLPEDNCAGGYLGVELTPMATTPVVCGGRTLEQDVMDLTLQVLVDAANPPAVVVTDAVDANDVAFSTDFPYVAPAN